MRFFVISLLVLLSVISTDTNANPFEQSPVDEPNPDLVQATRLLKTDPVQALVKLDHFINKPESPLTASNSVRNLNLLYLQKSHNNICQALLLKSQAQNTIGNVHSALQTLDYVTQLAKSHDNINIQAKAVLLQAKYRWENSGDPQAAVHTLAQSKIIKNLSLLTPDIQMQYQLLMGSIYLGSATFLEHKGNIPQIEDYLKNAHHFLNTVSDPRLKIEYYLLNSRLNTLLQQRNATQKNLMTAIGLAIAHHEDDLVADAQLQLARFYVTYGGYSLGLNYAGLSASYYEKTNQHNKLASALKLLGHIHSYENRPNLALVNYLNAIDMAHSAPNSDKLIDITLGTAFAYLQLNELKKANDYIVQAENIINSESSFEVLHPIYMLLKGEYFLRDNKVNLAITFIQNGLQEIPTNDFHLRLYAYSLLIQTYQKNGNRSKENVYLQYKVRLLDRIHLQQMEFNTETLQQHEQLIEKITANYQLQANYASLKKQYSRSHQLNLWLFGGIAVAVIALCYFIIVTTNYRNKFSRNRSSDFRHPRTHLANLRKLNATVPTQLQSTVHLCEQILRDEQTNLLDDNPFKALRMKVALINLDWPNELRLRPDFSYQATVKLERELGTYLQTTLGQRGQLFQLHDNGFLYLEPGDVSSSPEAFAEYLLRTCEQFPHYQAVAGQISIGGCHYPLLPRATCGVQLPELLSVLQLAQSAAAQLNQQYDQNHWVMLLPISTAAPASFQGDLHVACMDAIRRGLIKVAHSATPKPVDWTTLLAQYVSSAHTPASLSTEDE